MPQIILKGRTAHLANGTLLQDILISIRTRQFHNFLRKLTTSYFRPVNIAKFLRTAFLYNTSGGCFYIFQKVIKQPFRNLVMTS